jgi:hypothetical protein
MENLFTYPEMLMLGLILFSSFWVFLFNYRQDNKEKYNGHLSLVALDLVINMGMAVTGYLLVYVVFAYIPQLTAYAGYKYPVGYLFGLTSNVSIPIVLKWFQQQITKKLNEAGKGK